MPITLILIRAWCFLSLALAAHTAAGARTGTVFRRIKQESYLEESDRARSWRTFNSKVPGPDICRNLKWDQSLVVAARLDEDVSWMATDLVPWQQFLVYAIKSEGNATHKIQSDTGRESQAYLQFIYDYYDCLPQAVIFIHAHRSSPHSPDIVSDLKRLQWQTLSGYLSMSRPQRLNTFYFSEIERQKPNPNDTAEKAHWSQFAFEQNELIRGIWPELFQDELGKIPAQLTAAGGGQFAVTKAKLKKHPRKFYQKALRWLQTTEVDGFWAGLIFEQLWSYILGAGTIYNHPPECQVFACAKDGLPLVPKWEALLARKTREHFPRTLQ